MCGIVGYIGMQPAVPVLMAGLKSLEYRGYDSAGISVCVSDEIYTVKAKGDLSHLEAKLKETALPEATLGIGHTRWATHGAPSDVNSHPHMGRKGIVALVHNGIIENYLELKAELMEKGCTFQSETDTEIVAQLFEYLYDGDMVGTLRKVLQRVHGAYALGIICKDHPDQLLAVRKDSPLLVGLGKGENFIASDIPALLSYTRDYYLLNDNEIVLLKRDSVSIFDLDGNPIEKEVFHVSWDASVAEKEGYDYFMMKEIMEQPRALQKTISPRILEGNINFEGIGLTEEMIASLRRIHIVACGSAWHAGIVGRYVLEKLTRIPVEVDIASEFRYRDPIFGENELCIVISQSGETADTLAALRLAKQAGVRILSIVNVVGSSIARESDDVIYTWAGPEIAVATTKGYTTQLSVLYMIALYFAKAKGLLRQEEEKMYLEELKLLPEKTSQVLHACNSGSIEALAKQLCKREDFFIIGRGIDYSAAMESSLKLKEISYIHSEAYAAGELKHGTISLIEEGTPVIAIATQSTLLEKLVSNIKEVKARGAYVIAITEEGNSFVADVADEVIYIPKATDLFTASYNVLPMQIFAYHVAVARGCNVDKPRNLAKSVTVE